MTPKNLREKANFIWQVADDILRGAFKAHEHGDVIRLFIATHMLHDSTFLLTGDR